MNYRAMAQAIRNERVELLRMYAEAGYRPALAKIGYMAMGLDVALQLIVDVDNGCRVLERTVRDGEGMDSNGRRMDRA